MYFYGRVRAGFAGGWDGEDARGWEEMVNQKKGMKEDSARRVDWKESGAMGKEYHRRLECAWILTCSHDKISRRRILLERWCGAEWVALRAYEVRYCGT